MMKPTREIARFCREAPDFGIYEASTDIEQDGSIPAARG
jgi:hypothetical protein